MARQGGRWHRPHLVAVYTEAQSTRDACPGRTNAARQLGPTLEFLPGRQTEPQVTSDRG